MLVIALCCLGDAELALGRHDAAKDAFDRALELGCKHGHATRHDARAGRARVALARGDLCQKALADVEELLSTPDLASRTRVLNSLAQFR